MIFYCVYYIQTYDHICLDSFQLQLSLMVGLCNTADAMEMMILSILSPALHCHWGITQVQQATLTTVVFFGDTIKRLETPVP